MFADLTHSADNVPTRLYPFCHFSAFQMILLLLWLIPLGAAGRHVFYAVGQYIFIPLFARREPTVAFAVPESLFAFEYATPPFVFARLFDRFTTRSLEEICHVFRERTAIRSPLFA